MQGLTISEAARQTGFTESALRFYEQEGVVIPARSESGYRQYSDQDIEALRFVARAKGMGLSLTEIGELVSLLDAEECGPIQERISALVADRIAEAQGRIADLVGFTARLQETAARLNLHTPDGPCNEACGCTSDPVSVEPRTATAVPLSSANDTIACTLDASRIGDRFGEWQRVTAQAVACESLGDGIRLLFPRDANAGAIASLAMAEQTCCSFFRFSLGIGPEAVTLDVTGPADAQPVIAAMMGCAA